MQDYKYIIIVQGIPNINIQTQNRSNSLIKGFSSFGGHDISEFKQIQVVQSVTSNVTRSMIDAKYKQPVHIAQSCQTM